MSEVNQLEKAKREFLANKGYMEIPSFSEFCDARVKDRIRAKLDRGVFGGLPAMVDFYPSITRIGFEDADLISKMKD